MLGVLLPARLKCLYIRQGAEYSDLDLAPLIRLTRLEALHIAPDLHMAPGLHIAPRKLYRLPHLPALKTFSGEVPLCMLYPVAGTLETICVSGYDFGQIHTDLSKFTCLRKLHYYVTEHLFPTSQERLPPPCALSH